MVWLCLVITGAFVWHGIVRRVLGAAAASRREPALYARQGARVRRSALHLQGLIIKVGQFLSTRADLLPDAFTQQLSGLQDVVPPVPWSAVRAQLQAAYGQPPEEVFASFSPEPLAAASLAQVHAATLPDGREVAVKVLRPGIDGLVRTDLGTLAVVARYAQRHTSWGRRFDLAAVHAEFAAVSLQELNLEGEGARAGRFRRNFAGTRWVSAPEVYPEWTRPTVLVMSRVGGMAPDDVAALQAQGVDPTRLARRLVRSYMQQLLYDGFYHADPHPGNLFVQSDGVLVYVDFGMMGELAESDRQALRLFFRGVLQRDVDLVTQATIDLGLVRPGTDRTLMRRALSFAVDQMMGIDMTQPGSPAFRAFVDEMRDFLYTHPFQLQARYTMLGRAFGILAGLVDRLAPGESFFRLLVESALQYLNIGAAGDILAGLLRDAPSGRQAAGGGLSVPGLGTLPGWATEALRLVQDTVSAPARLDRTVQALSRGDWRVPVDLTPLQRELARQGRRMRSVGWALWGGAATVAGAVLRSGGHALGSDILWVLGGLLLLAFLRGAR